MIIIKHIEKIQPANEKFVSVDYGSDMFVKARPLLAKGNIVVAVDEAGDIVCELVWEGTTYIHAYQYGGGVDMCFLNQYDVLFLHCCNEYSVELCLTALDHWEGKRLILVGGDWEKMIPYLPDLDKIECFYEEKLEDKRFMELTQSMSFLHVINGLPHEEAVDRYKNGIMYYDEIMSFTYMFSNLRNLGEENPNKRYALIDAGYESLGLFSIFHKTLVVTRYVKSKGIIPVIGLRSTGGSYYQDDKDENIWEKFYIQPEGITEAEILKSKNVYYLPRFYNGSVMDYIMMEKSEGISLSWEEPFFNKQVQQYIYEKEKQFLPDPEHTLGVLARGTDYRNASFQNHSIHASKEQIADRIDEMMQEGNEYRYIYLATEDAEYHDFFKNRYGSRLFSTDQKRYTTKKNQMLSEMHREDEKKRKSDGFLCGLEYILAIYLLSKCKSLLASGGCAGVSEAIDMNGGRYRETYIFQLGKNS